MLSPKVLMMDGAVGGKRPSTLELSLPQSDVDVDRMLEAYSVSPEGRHELDAALIDIYIKEGQCWINSLNLNNQASL